MHQPRKHVKQRNYEVLLIIGYGHSGTTILDMVLGSAEGSFSCGELTYITRNQFFDEYCSCGSVIRECSFWSVVFEKWVGNDRTSTSTLTSTSTGRSAQRSSQNSAQAQPPMTLEEYRLLRDQFEGNKAFLRTVFRYLFRDDAYRRYVLATERLYDLIAEESGASVIVDSSKSASRAFLLASFCRVRVVHAIRNFRGVLNSERKDVKVDLKAGIEAASKPKKAKKVLIDWVLSNVMCSVSRIWFGGKKLHFRQWIRFPDLVLLVQPALQPGFEKGLFKAEHMVAGNAIRMKPPQKLRVGQVLGSGTQGLEAHGSGGPGSRAQDSRAQDSRAQDSRAQDSHRYPRLGKRHQLLGRIVETLLPSWNR